MENMGKLKKFYAGKRVLVTGYTGFKGSWLCMALLELGAEVWGVGLPPKTDPSCFELLNLKQKMTSCLFDIRDLEKLKKVFAEFQPQIVFHLAAQPLVIDSYRDPVYTFDVNIMGTVNVLECIRENACVVSAINVTTDKVYENREQADYRYQEQDRLNGYDPYSNSKSCSELVTASYIRSFFQAGQPAISTCRAGNVIGGGDFSANRIIPDCIRYTLRNEPIIVRNPNSVRPYQHVLEADLFYLELARKQAENPQLAGSYNIGPQEDDCITTGQLCALFCENWKGARWQAVDWHGPHEAGFLKLNCDRAKDRLGWQPRWHVDQAVKKTVEWAQALARQEPMDQVTLRQIHEYWEEEEK